MQIECIISSLLEYYAEMQFILCKDSARRVERKELAQFSFPKRRLFYHELVSRIAYINNSARIICLQAELSMSLM